MNMDINYKAARTEKKKTWFKLVLYKKKIKVKLMKLTFNMQRLFGILLAEREGRARGT